ncbi:MAG: metallophosphoesterase [Rhizonema sp. PD38]|nr:metallophosphoesterase [Rhizonema sp. PD38]
MHWLLSGSLSVENLTVRIADLPASLEGLTLVQLSDLHYDGKRLSEGMLEKAIAFCNQAEPDLILLTGDYVTDDPSPIHELVLRLKHLQSRVGIYAVLGNHDIYYSRSKAEITSALTGIGINVLWNEIAYPLGKELPIVGLADYWSREFNPKDVMHQLDPTTPCIVLSHNPDTADILQKWRVDLQLSGHTHGGQIVIPGIGPIVVYYKKVLYKLPKKLRRWVPLLQGDCSKVVRHWEWFQGLHKVANNQLYVNRGLGTYAPGRLFCPPEVTVITLQRQE